MIDTDEAVRKLTEPHTEHVDGIAVEHDPLLIELQDSATAQSGRGTGGGGVGIPINLGVIEIQDYIRRRLRMIRKNLALTATKNLIEGTREAWEKIKTERAGSRLTDQDMDWYESEFTSWVRRISEEVSPPSTTEMVTPCPECGETRAFLRGDTVQAVVIKWYPDELDRAPLGKCRSCGHEWVGWGSMHYDLEVVNRDALAKLGVDVSSFARVNLI